MAIPPSEPSPARRQYTAEFKHEAVQLSERVGAARAATNLGVPEGLIYAWRRKLGKGTKLVSSTSDGVTAIDMELASLRREVAELRMERDILKKAATYFAKLSE